MRDLVVNASILGMLLLAAPPAGAQSMVELGAAMGISNGLNSTAAGSATTALRARETIASHAPSGNGGWVDAGDGGHGSAAGPGKGWATASSGSPTASGKNAWASPGSSSGAGGKGWASKSSGSGTAGKGWASRKDASGFSARASATNVASARDAAPSAPTARDLATSGTPSSR